MRWAGVLLLGVLAGACDRAPATPISREQFVTVMVQLRRASLEVGTPGAAFEARRAEILREAGVTEEQLREYTRVLQSHPDHLRESFDSITARMSRHVDEE